MYTGNNPTALQSMEWIADALVSLMKEFPYDTIVIKQICGEAQLSRKTFYNCFDSKDDVLRWRLRQYLGHYLIPQENPTGDPVEMIARFYRRAFEEHAEFFHLLMNHADYLLIEEIHQRMNASVPALSATADLKNPLYYNAYLASGLAGLLTFWLKDPNHIEAEQVVAIMQDILSGSYYQTSGIMRRTVP